MRKKGFLYAKQASQMSDYYKCHTGCAIMYGSKLLALGWNCNKTHTSQYIYNKNFRRNFDNEVLPNKLHAEVMALTKIQYLDVDFSKLDLYVYREADGMLKLAKPCPACEGFIRALGIRNIHYTGDNSYVKEVFLY
jgi:deoxycytidylate deaminase